MAIHAVYQQSSSSYSRDLDNPGSVISTAASEVDDIDEYGNVLATTSNSTDEFGSHTVTVNRTFTSDTANWYLDRLDTEKTSYATIINRPSTDPYLVSGRNDLDTAKWLQTNYSNYHVSRQPQSLTTTTSDSTTVARTQSVAMTYNAYGLPLSVATTADVMSATSVWSSETRTHSIAYSSNNSTVSSDGYFPYKLTNALNQISYQYTDDRFGTPSQSVDPNGLAVQKVYDGFGRQTAEKSPGSPWIYRYIDTAVYDANAPDYAQWKIVS